MAVVMRWFNKGFLFCCSRVIAVLAESRPVLITNPETAQSKTETKSGLETKTNLQYRNTSIGNINKIVLL